MGESSSIGGFPVDLPSGGRFYSSESARAVLQMIRGEQEALIADANPQTFPAILDQVLQTLAAEKPVDDWSELLIGDKYALMFYARQVSYGNNYAFHLTCPNCKGVNHIQVDIREAVQMREGVTLTEDQKASGEVSEPFNVSLPHSGKQIQFRLLRVADERKMVRFVRDYRKNFPGKGDPTYLFTLAQGLVSVDGQPTDFTTALSFVQNAVSLDTVAMRDALDENDVGPELELDFTCQLCQFYFYQMLPLDVDFFRPGSARRRSSTGTKV